MDSKDQIILQQQKTIESMAKQIESLSRQVENLTEMIILMRKDKFGPSSEKVSHNDDKQLSIFNEVEVEADPNAPEPAKRDGSKFKACNSKTKRFEVLKDLPVKEIDCELPDDEQFCDNCGTQLKPMGKRVVREELEYIPAKLSIVRYVQYSYECPKCKHTENPFIIKATTPTSLMNHSLASPSSVARVMYQKYVQAIPLYRQEKEWEAMGIALSRATMANWVIRCAEDYLNPVIKRLHKELLKRDIVHCDETPVQVLKEDGRKPQTKSYMWLYRTGNDGKAPIILYDYKPSRSGEKAVEFLKGFKGYFHADGYSGYNKLSGVKRCGCWAHLRRKFYEAVPSRKSSSELTSSEAGVKYCDRLFAIEKELQDLSPEERYIKRLELEKPVLEAFWSWIDTLNPLRSSALGRAVTYAKSQKPYMETYLLDGRLNISNNPAENAIRPFTVGRKNWLFSDTPKGAKASADVYSLVETAKANGLNVYAYLEHLLLYMPTIDWRNYPELMDDLMPWSDQVQAECRD